MKRSRRKKQQPTPAPAAEAAAPPEADPFLAMSSRQRQQYAMYKVLRLYADAAGLHRSCGHSPCARARKCVHAGMKCYEDNKDDWREFIFPHLRAALAKHRGTGTTASEET